MSHKFQVYILFTFRRSTGGNVGTTIDNYSSIGQTKHPELFEVFHRGCPEMHCTEIFDTCAAICKSWLRVLFRLLVSQHSSSSIQHVGPKRFSTSKTPLLSLRPLVPLLRIQYCCTLKMAKQHTQYHHCHPIPFLLPWMPLSLCTFHSQKKYSVVSSNHFATIAY